MWKDAKDSVDLFLKKNVNEGISETLDKSNSLYSTMKSTEEVIEAFDKVTSSTTLGKDAKYGEVGAVNWSQLHKELSDVYIASPEIKSSIELTEDFMNKFGDMDARLFGKTISSAEKTGSETIIAESPSGHAKRMLVVEMFDTIKKYIPTTEGYKQRKAQDAIRNSIKNSKNQVEFLRNVRRHPDTVMETKKEIDTLLEGIDTSAKGIAQKQAQSKTLIKKAQDLNLRVNRADNSIDKASLRVDSRQSVVEKLENAKNPNAKAIESAYKQLDIAERDLELAVQNHAKVKEEFDAVGLELDDMNMFMNPKQSANRPKPKDSL